MDPKLMTTLARLGLPGVGIGVFYLIIRDFPLDRVEQSYIVPLYILLIVALTTVNIVAVLRTGNSGQSGSTKNKEAEHSEQKSNTDNESE